MPATRTRKVEEIEDFDLADTGGVSPVIAQDDDDEDAAGVERWNGRTTTLAVGFSMVRDHNILGKGDEVTFRASKDRAGQWHGPEGTHVRDLQALGMFLDTAEYEERVERQAVVNSQRGVTRENLAELRPVTRKADLHRLPWARDLVAKNDTSELNQARKDAADSLAQLVGALTGQRPEISRDYAGGQAPGSAPNADGTPLAQ